MRLIKGGILVSFLVSTEFWYAVIRCTTPVLFATLAIGIAGKCGVINLSVEGTMLVSALTGVIVSAFTGSLWMGALAALFLGVLIVWILGYFVIKMHANPVVTGIAINLAAMGGTIFTLYEVANDKSISASLMSKVFPTITIPVVHEIPILGEILSGHNVLTYVALLLVVVMYILLYKTSLGIKIRAVGESEEAAKSVGINIIRTKAIALTLSGLLASLGGMFLSMGYLSMFTANMTAGRGYIALATDAMASSHPIGGFFASIIYGFSDSIAVYMQKSSIPLEIIQTFPYLFIILIYCIFMFRQKRKNKEISIL